MTKEGQELLILILIFLFLYQCVFTDNIEKAGHVVFVKMGIADEIEKLDKAIRGEW